MITGLYSAASGMIIQEKVQDTIAQNMAGSMMPGFKREEAVIRSFPDVMLYETYRGMSKSTDNPRFNHAIGRVGTGAGIDWVYVDHTPGATQYTDNDTDMVIQGDGYFALQTNDGLRFTRAGSFLVDKEGYLVNPEGHYLVGQGINNNRIPSPIEVGKEDFYVDPRGFVSVKRADGNGIMRDTILDQIRVVDFADKDKVFREPGNLFRVEEGSEDNIIPPERFTVHQGYIEKANSMPTTEMVKLIDSNRIHEASARVVQALDETLDKAVNQVGSAR